MTEGYELAEDADSPIEVAFMAAVRAVLHAYRGQIDAARADAARSVQLAQGLGLVLVGSVAAQAFGAAALSVGDAAAAHGDLGPFADIIRATGIAEPSMCRFLPDDVEALILLGELGSAESLLAPFEARSAEMDRAWGRAAAARCRGLLLAAGGDIDGAMYDSADAATIPLDATVAAGYVDGYGSYPAICQKVPNATHLSIAVNADHDADCLDVEPGHAQPDQVPAWWKRQRARGVTRPVIYASVDPMRTDLLPVLAKAAIARSAVRLWTAHYTGQAHICGPGSCGKTVEADGTQFTNHAHGIVLDQSLLRDDFFAAPSVYTCDGQKSLDGLSEQLHCPTATILQLTAEHSPNAVFTERMAAYLNAVFAADQEKVPEGITVYHPAGTGAEPFHSHGTQTLQGLALAFNCQPSAVVRVTAENSPGAECRADMAKYLNGVFTRSGTLVPAGIHLYYDE